LLGSLLVATRGFVEAVNDDRAGLLPSLRARSDRVGILIPLT